MAVSRAILSVGIHGASGRMGTRLIQLMAQDPMLKLGAALVRDGHPGLGRDAAAAAGLAPAGIAFSQSLPPDSGVDVMIDFSLPPAVPGIVACCRTRKI